MDLFDKPVSYPAIPAFSKGQKNRGADNQDSGL
jgi:hypothetical protein